MYCIRSESSGIQNNKEKSAVPRSGEDTIKSTLVAVMEHTQCKQ